MRTKYLFFNLIMLGCVITSPLHAWQVTVTTEDNGEEQVVVTNTQELQQTDAYVVWVDKDAKRAEDMFQSWTVDKDWQSGLMPVTKDALDLSKFSARKLAKFKQKCAEKHRCFLAMVAVPHGKDPLDVSQWQASSILPLTNEAGRERLPGQQFFLPPESRNTTTTGTEKDTDAVTTAPTASATTTDSTTTEKPDIFKLVDKQLLYANGSAQRFQVIDLADPTQPKLAGWMSLTGTPREVYSLGQTMVLLQTNYDEKQGAQTKLTVVQQKNGTLETVDEVTLSGNFLQSRRRGDLIYAVSQSDSMVTIAKPECVDCGMVYMPMVQITALRLDDQGKLVIVDKAEISGYSPEVAIFPDHLVIANHDSQEWSSTNIQIFNLAVPNAALAKLPLLKVPGQVPSEFHLNVYNQQFRVVYGPTFNDKVGSTLAIYDLSKPTLDLLGKVENIAPGEALFATRFTENRAFVVTYQRTDPLWAIDLSNPQAPKILGELKVPGWSEKLFFNNNRLFAIGTHDQPEPGETNQWVRRVALSLFDVADAQNLNLLSRFIPLLDLGITYSYSEALSDERALFLDWENSFASIPIQSWEAAAGTFLQLVSFQNDKIEEVGRIASPVQIRRSLPIDKQTLAALGDQEILTLAWEMGNPNTQAVKILGSLELAHNLIRVQKQGDNLWAVGQGDTGMHRLYRYTTTDINAPAQQMKLPQSYNDVVVGDKLAVFYNYNPLAIQVVELDSGVVRPAQRLEATNNDDTKMAADWVNRSQWQVQDDKLYVAETRYIATPVTYMSKDGVSINPNYYQGSQTLLRSWKLSPEGAQEEKARSIPGEPIGVTVGGKYVVTREMADQLRLNLLSLENNAARLVNSRELPCRSNSQANWVDGAVYVTCIVNDPTDQTLVEMSTPILKLDPFSGQLAEGFAEVGRWDIKGYHAAITVTPEGIALIGSNYYYPMPVDIATTTTDAKPGIMPYYSPDCKVYQLTVGSPATLLKQFDTCPLNGTTSALTATQAWVAKGFAGLDVVKW